MGPGPEFGSGGDDEIAEVVGATIGGGGAEQTEVSNRDGQGAIECRDDIGLVSCLNRVTDNFGTIGGGAHNESDYLATVGGGAENAARGGFSTVGGGTRNTASDDSATVGGGFFNTASPDYARDLNPSEIWVQKKSRSSLI